MNQNNRIVCSNLVFDLGAHLGEDTAYYISRGFQVVSVECEPNHVAHLRQRFAAEITSGQVRLVDKAVSRNGGMTRFYRNLDVSVWGTVVPAWADRNIRYRSRVEEIMVPSITPDELFLMFGMPHYLKIDIEGEDVAVLESLEGFECRPSYVSVESEHMVYDGIRHEFDVFDRLGYFDFKLSPQHLVRSMQVPDGTTQQDAVSYVFEEHASGPFGEDLYGPWLTAREALSEYKAIFVLYDLYEAVETGILSGSLTAFRERFGHDTGGWYDTHARHSCVAGRP